MRPQSERHACLRLEEGRRESAHLHLIVVEEVNGQHQLALDLPALVGAEHLALVRTPRVLEVGAEESHTQC